MNSTKSGYMFCHNCVNFFKNSFGEPVICPECKTVVDWNSFSSLLDYLSDAVRFGFQYRIQYEKDLSKNGNLNTRKFIAPPYDILIWLALTVIAGVVGNASYDIAKFATKKLISKISSESENAKIPCAYIVLTQEEYKQFESYILDYYAGPKNISPEIRAALIDEMIVHEIENVAEETKEPELLRDQRYLMSEAVPRAKKRFSKRITEEELKEMWKAIDMSG